MNNPKDPSKRRKFGQACTICRRKKVKCDSKKPTCSNCLRLGNECEYLPLAKKRNPQKEYIVELEKKIELMEALLKTTRKNNHQDTLDVLSHIGTSNDQIAADDLSMLRAKSMQELCFGYGPDVMDSPSWFPADSSSDLSLEESKILVDTYFKKVNNTIEIIHRPTFMKDFEKNRVAKPLLYAMYAVTLCTYCDEITPTHSSKFTNGNLYARKAKELLSAASQLDVSTIQALIIMTCFQFGHSPTSWIFPG
ncbi:hypothetical protein K7432_001305 [Basidiobolus ranarum]|uniref:Zn(2)-C6 fungal-type domain-containing protein n=1 Tax=Basidiobolus ranarum TaxID=34480 RepID=A0ABR2X3C1_9FUNG